MRIIVGACVVALLASPAVAKKAPTGTELTLPIVEVLDPSGSITVTNVNDSVAKIRADLIRCGAREGWYGDALSWIVVDWKGKVTKLELAVGKPSIEKCFTKALKTLVVGGARGRATVVVRVRLEPTYDD